MEILDLLGISVHTLMTFIVEISIMLFLIIIFIVADLFAGIHRSKINKIPITSKALRRSFNKSTEYFIIMFVIAIISAFSQWALSQLHFSIPKFPILPAITTLAVGIVELKSIFENMQDSMKKNAKELLELYKSLDENNKKDVVNKIMDYIITRPEEDDSAPTVGSETQAIKIKKIRKRKKITPEK